MSSTQANIADPPRSRHHLTDLGLCPTTTTSDAPNGRPAADASPDRAQSPQTNEHVTMLGSQMLAIARTLDEMAAAEDNLPYDLERKCLASVAEAEKLLFAVDKESKKYNRTGWRAWFTPDQSAYEVQLREDVLTLRDMFAAASKQCQVAAAAFNRIHKEKAATGNDTRNPWKLVCSIHRGVDEVFRQTKPTLRVGRGSPESDRALMARAEMRAEAYYQRKEHISQQADFKAKKLLALTMNCASVGVSMTYAALEDQPARWFSEVRACAKMLRPAKKLQKNPVADKGRA